MPEAQRLRVAVIGSGGRGKEFVRGILEEGRSEIAALVDVNQDSMEGIKTEFGLEAKCYGSTETMLTEAKPDLVTVALWTEHHRPVLDLCINAGVKGIVSEKPMAGTWKDSLAISQLASEKKVFLTFCHQRRFASGNIAVRKELAKGVFGKIERMDLFSPPHLIDCGTHTLDQARSFNEESPVTWVHGAVDVTDTVSYFNLVAECRSTNLLMFENGVTATLRTGRDDMALWGGVRVVGELGFVEVLWDGQVKRAVVYSDPNYAFPEFIEKPNEQMIGVIKDAIDGVTLGSPSELSHESALSTAEALFAMYESARIRERVSLPLDPEIGNPLHDILEKK